MKPRLKGMYGYAALFVPDDKGRFVLWARYDCAVKNVSYIDGFKILCGELKNNYPSVYRARIS